MKTLRFLWLTALLTGAPVVFAAEEQINGIAALVNDSIITQQDLELLIGRPLESLRRQFLTEAPTPERQRLFQQKADNLQRDGLDQLIQLKLVLSDYNAKGFKLPESLINDEVERRIRDKPFNGNRAEFIKTLKGEGTSFEAFRSRVHDEFIYGAMKFKNVSQDLVISPAKIERYYLANLDKYHVEEMVKLRVIVLSRTTADDAATRKRAEEILTKLNEGADFAEMARVYSDGSQRADGGYWGWVEKAKPAKEIADMAFGLPVGQRSGVIETKDAYCLLLVEDKHPEQVRPLGEVRDEIEKTLQVQEQGRLEKAWIERLKAKAFIRYF